MQNPHQDWEAEQEALRETLRVIEDNIGHYSAQKTEYDAIVKKLHIAYRSNNPELISDLYLNMDLQDMTNRSLKNNFEASRKPYFGGIAFTDETDGEDRKIRIGKRGIARRDGEQHIYDWRAPVSTLYYENSLSRTSYEAPEGDMPVSLTAKRTYEIAAGKLIDYYDSEVVTNDELLQKYLAHNKDIVLGEIIATIQKDQNAVIRVPAWRSVIVQGSAGSGKTTVAMHRIAYLLYNYPQQFKSSDFYIVGGNTMFLRYITGSLPDLDVANVNQMTMPNLLLYCLDIDKANVLPLESGGGEVYNRCLRFKSSLAYAGLCEQYMDSLAMSLFASEDVAQAGRVFLTAREIGDFCKAHAGKGFQEIADMLNDKLAGRVEYRQGAMFDELNPAKYSKNYFQKRMRGVKAASVFRDFVDWLSAYAIHDPDTRQTVALIGGNLRRKRYDVYDLAMLLHIKNRLGQVTGLERVKHVIVDEAQDFGELILYALTRTLKKATFTVIGDVTQNISGHTGLFEWDTLTGSVFGKHDVFFTLAKSYRNTIEISKYAALALRKLPAAKYPVEPIVRHGRSVAEHVFPDARTALGALPALLEDIKKRGYGMIAVICRNERGCAKLLGALAGMDDVYLATPDMEGFSLGVTLFPAPLVKGLEFDAVVVWDADATGYGDSPSDARLLYVALTRALHELHVCAVGKLTGLLTVE